MFKRFSAVWLAAAVGLLGGCASNIPELIRGEPDDMPQLREVQADPGKFEGRQVRWGGEVVGVTNQEGVAWIEILARPLWSDGPPRTDGAALGRFRARVQGFVDPAEYAEGEAVTVAGRVIGGEVRTIGDHPYSYPLVEVEARHIWPRQDIDPYRYYYSPFFYDPWWPYRYHHGGRYGRW